MSITFDRKLDPIALAGLFIALLTGGYQLYLLFQGPKLSLLAPEQIDFSHDLSSNHNLVITARFTHINNGGSDYNDIVKKETIQFQLPSEAKPNMVESYQLTWQYFVNYVQDANGSIKQELSQSAQPKLINARSVLSHETQFYPRTTVTKDPTGKPIFSKIKLDDFKRRLDSLQGQEIQINLSSEYIHSKPRSASCKLKIENKWVSRLEVGKIVSPVCSNS